MHVYLLSCQNDWQENISGGPYYASKRRAEAKCVELNVQQAKEEEEDWIANPCECGDRKCYRREHFFYQYSVDRVDLVELSMRELMKIELADNDD